MTAEHYTDGTEPYTTCALFPESPGNTASSTPNGCGPIPLAPIVIDCAQVDHDPDGHVWLTAHVVYTDGTTAATDPFPYNGSGPGQTQTDMSAFLQGKQGVIYDTWDIGAGRSPETTFDCRPPVTMCVDGQEQQVEQADVAAAEAQGATGGPCAAPPPPPENPETPVVPAGPQTDVGTPVAIVTTTTTTGEPPLPMTGAGETVGLAAGGAGVVLFGAILLAKAGRSLRGAR